MVNLKNVVGKYFFSFFSAFKRYRHPAKLRLSRFKRAVLMLSMLKNISETSIRRVVILMLLF